MCDAQHRGVVSADTLAEVYSVLTWTPFKPTLYPGEAWQIVTEMIRPHMELVTFTGEEYQEVVRNSAFAGWTGGKIHDLAHLSCAQKAGSNRIYTLNFRDFRALAPEHWKQEIVTP